MSTQPDDGGPAFPQLVEPDVMDMLSGKVKHGGMTLRDWFAGQALDRTIEMVAMDRAKHPSVTNEEWRAQFAVEAYAIADAMLALRTPPSAPGHTGKG